MRTKVLPTTAVDEEPPQVRAWGFLPLNQWILAISFGIPFVGMLILLAFIWLMPRGVGEYRDSPDGKYEVQAYSYTRGTLIQGRITYVEIQMTDNHSGRLVWRLQRFPLSTEKVPEFGDRNRRFIEWDDDSQFATIELDSMGQVVVPVP